MPDQSGSAFPFVDITGDIHPGMTRLVFLLGNAPNPPAGYIEKQIAHQRTSDDDERKTGARPANPLSTETLTALWQLRWAKEALRLVDR